MIEVLLFGILVALLFIAYILYNWLYIILKNQKISYNEIVGLLRRISNDNN